MRYDIYSGLFLLAMSLGACVMSYRLGFGEIHDPGPGYIPFLMAALLGLMSLGMIIRTLFRGTGVHPGDKVFKGVKWKTLILVVCSLIGYGVVFQKFGFSICNFILMVVLLRVIGGKKWWLTLTISLIIVISSHLIFVFLLGVEFPKGFLGI
jgi:putative tricarboxylic transport membrane protein